MKFKIFTVKLKTDCDHFFEKEQKRCSLYSFASLCSYDLAIFISFSPFSFYETARLFKNCSFFKICAFIIAFKRNINSRIYPTEKCREKHGVIRHLDALIWPTLSKRFAFALYQPCIFLLMNDKTLF